MRVYSTLAMLCFCDEHKVELIIFNFYKNMLQWLRVALPLELGALQVVSKQRGLVDWETSVT